MSTVMTDLALAARWFGALSDETRLRVVEILGGGERCVCDLQEMVGASQSRLSFHLRKLKDAGLVTDRRVGRWAYYSLDADALDAIAAYLESAKPVEDGPGCCGAR